MATKKEEQNLEAKVEEIGKEIEQIENRLGQAHARVEQASLELDRKEVRLRELSPAVFSGDDKAQREFEELEASSEVLVRSRRVASDAAEGFAKELEEAKERHAEAKREVHRQRYRILSEELGEVDLKRDDLAQQLKEIIEERGRLISAMSGEMNSYDQEQANRMATAYVGAERYWLNEEFRQWLR